MDFRFILSLDFVAVIVFCVISIMKRSIWRSGGFQISPPHCQFRYGNGTDGKWLCHLFVNFPFLFVRVFAVTVAWKLLTEL
jgi:hypothetical protein